MDSEEQRAESLNKFIQEQQEGLIKKIRGKKELHPSKGIIVYKTYKDKKNNNPIYKDDLVDEWEKFANEYAQANDFDNFNQVKMNDRHRNIMYQYVANKLGYAMVFYADKLTFDIDKIKEINISAEEYKKAKESYANMLYERALSKAILPEVKTMIAMNILLDVFDYSEEEEQEIRDSIEELADYTDMSVKQITDIALDYDINLFSANDYLNRKEIESLLNDISFDREKLKDKYRILIGR